MLASPPSVCFNKIDTASRSVVLIEAPGQKAETAYSIGEAAPAAPLSTVTAGEVNKVVTRVLLES